VIKLLHGDCLERMHEISSGSIDMVLCDLPYGITQNKWDSVISTDKLWPQYKRICKKGAAIVLTSSQPFTSILVASNLAWYRHDWVWEKSQPKGHLNAKKAPLRAHELILVFGHGKLTYNPQKTQGHPRKTANNVNRANKLSNCYGAQDGITSYSSTERYPRSVIKFPSDVQKSKLHPTQKPVALMEYLIKTYTNEGDTVLDNCFGSCSTGIACQNTGRNFIGIEKDDAYFQIGYDRMNKPAS